MLEQKQKPAVANKRQGKKEEVKQQLRVKRD